MNSGKLLPLVVKMSITERDTWALAPLEKNRTSKCIGLSKNSAFWSVRRVTWMVNGTAFICHISGLHIQTAMAEAAVQGANLFIRGDRGAHIPALIHSLTDGTAVGSSCGFSILPKDTSFNMLPEPRNITLLISRWAALHHTSPQLP